MESEPFVGDGSLSRAAKPRIVARMVPRLRGPARDRRFRDLGLAADVSLFDPGYRTAGTLELPTEGDPWGRPGLRTCMGQGDRKGSL